MTDSIRNAYARSSPVNPSSQTTRSSFRRKTHRNMLYNTMGMATGYNYGWIGHVLGTNMKFDPDEFNFFKQRRDHGTTGAFRDREERFGV